MLVATLDCLSRRCAHPRKAVHVPGTGCTACQRGRRALVTFLYPAADGQDYGLIATGGHGPARVAEGARAGPPAQPTTGTLLEVLLTWLPPPPPPHAHGRPVRHTSPRTAFAQIGSGRAKVAPAVAGAPGPLVTSRERPPLVHAPRERSPDSRHFPIGHPENRTSRAGARERHPSATPRGRHLADGHLRGGSLIGGSLRGGSLIGGAERVQLRGGSSRKGAAGGAARRPRDRAVTRACSPLCPGLVASCGVGPVRVRGGITT